MTFKVATADDVDRIKNAAAESKGENLLSSDLPIGGRAYSSIQSQRYSASRGGKFTGSGNQARIAPTDGGFTAIHENLHLYGFGDRYTDVTYEMTVDGKSIGRTNVFSQSHVGFKSDIMSNGWDMNQTHIDDIASKALELSNDKGDNFTMGRTVDDAGGGKSDAGIDKVPKEYKSGNVEYSDPQSPATKK
jgi:hypothetical protein